MKLLPFAVLIGSLGAAFAQANSVPSGKPATLAGPTRNTTPVNFRVEYFKDVPAEGPDRQLAVISIGDQKIAVAPPQNCQISSSSDNLTIYLSNRGIFGQVTVTNSSFKPTTDFTTEVAAYQQAAEKALPAGTEGVELKGKSDDAYEVNDWTSLTFDWTYSFFGRRTHRQVSYINIDPDHQICVTIVSDEAQWEGARSIGSRFMRSWFKPRRPLQRE